MFMIINFREIACPFPIVSTFFYSVLQDTGQKNFKVNIVVLSACTVWLSIPQNCIDQSLWCCSGAKGRGTVRIDLINACDINY